MHQSLVIDEKDPSDLKSATVNTLQEALDHCQSLPGVAAAQRSLKQFVQDKVAAFAENDLVEMLQKSDETTLDLGKVVSCVSRCSEWPEAALALLPKFAMTLIQVFIAKVPCLIMSDLGTVKPMVIVSEFKRLHQVVQITPKTYISNLGSQTCPPSYRTN